MPSLPAMPIVDHPSTKPNGEPFTVDDRAYWELQSTYLKEHGGTTGIRRHVHLEYPKMLYRAKDALRRPDSYEQKIVGSASEQADVVRAGPWAETMDQAFALLNQQGETVARAAAEVAASAERMTEPAKRQYRKRSAESVEHVTE
jgi:hypothetical protein